MSLIVPRSVTGGRERRDGRLGADGDRSRSAPLADFRSERAYVLLGDPGAGKTEAFGTESRAVPGSIRVPARRFISRSLNRHPEWRAETLFIDGLDEVRAGRPDARRPMDLILERLEHLGSPNFRLSCRAADWLGRNDLQEIVSTAGYRDVRVLHLEPLRGEDILRILADLGVPDPRGFMRQAGERGLEGLLANPHSLGLLVKAVGGEEWPRDRRATFESACRALARERNDEHRAVQRSPPLLSLDRIMAAAGHLSALLLLSDKEHVSIDASEDPESLCLEDIADGNQPAFDHPAFLRAVRSNLFSVDPDGGFVPPHRQLSEFLAARFLAARIDSGVPASRILALMTGEDGVVVTELRGLSAWLAAFDRSSRRSLIRTDPVGIALYGDIQGFRGDEKESLLRAFAKRADEIKAWSWPSVALASLIDSHTVQLLDGHLGDEDRGEGRQAVVSLLLLGLAQVGGVHRSCERLEQAVRDVTWQPWVRQLALRALLRHSGSGEDGVSTLRALLDDIRDGRVEDRDGELAGILLGELYPDHVGREEIWDYLMPAPGIQRGYEYRRFWALRLLEKTKEGDVITLLRNLTIRDSEFRARISDHRLGGVTLKLLRAALAAAGEDRGISTVYDGLEFISSPELRWPRSRRPGSSGVSRSLAERPALQRELALEGLRRELRNVDSHELRERAWKVRRIVFGNTVPGDFAQWCLQEAVEAAPACLDIALALLEWSRPWHEGDSGSGISIEEVRAATEGVPGLDREVESLFDAQRQSEARVRVREMQVREQASEYLADDNREKAEFVAHVRKHAPELKEGTCPPGLLHHIAESYHDVFDDEAASTPRARLTKLLDGHADLVEASLAGFRRVARRRNRPTMREIIRLNEQGQRSLFDLPVLAGLDQMSPDSLDSCLSAEITRAAAFVYLTPVNLSGHPEWFLRTLKRRPRAVAEALIKVTRSRIRRRLDCSYLWHLSREPSYRAVARLAAVPLLRAFPTRCTEPQVSALHEVLLAAVKWQPSGIEEAIRARAARPGMDVSQQALWLAAGLFLSPDEYLNQLTTFVEGGEEARSRQIVGFMAPGGVEIPQRTWRTSALGRLIRLLGSRYSPWKAPSPGVGSFVDEDRVKVEGLITRWVADLASRTDPDACNTLQSLVDDPALEGWRWSLTQERSQQIVARRNATFAVPELKAIQVTLANERPANPADLAALVADRLKLLAVRIPRSNTDDWRQYWNEGSSSSLPRPKHEDACRDALLSDLRQLLPDGVDAQPEGHYARDKRADIRVSFNGSAIAVEIKKDSHRKLWSAAADQLVRQYTIDPDSSGYGIYLVLWFGLGEMPVPPTGRRPKTPEELRQRLEEHLEGPYRHKVRVTVIDVSGSVDS
ncbi:MAG: hypothetical protein F4Y41_20490 [Gammaproteobacteria bacterium]|nr:hypothetical protein [Gammaproteobacteria bacterium]